MKKFTQIFENKSDFINKLGTSEEEIQDCVLDLIDLGYKVKSRLFYLSEKGEKREVDDFFSQSWPILEISIDRFVDDDKGDVRNWDGGVHYESGARIINSINDSISRLESMFSGKCEVYYAIRSVDDILVRLVFDSIKKETSLDVEILDEAINKVGRVSFIEELFEERYYKIEETWQSGKTKCLEVKTSRSIPVLTSLIKKLIDFNTQNNFNDLKKIFNAVGKSIYNDVNKNGKLSYSLSSDGLNRDLYPFENKIEIKNGDVKYLTITYLTKLAKEDQVITKKSLFKKDIFEYKIYDMEITIKNHLTEF